MTKRIKVTHHYNFGGMHFATYDALTDYISSVRPPSQEIVAMNDAGKIIHENRLAPDGLSAIETKTFESQETYDAWVAARAAMATDVFTKAGWQKISEQIEEIEENA